MSIEKAVKAVREKLDVEEEDFEEIDDTVLVKVYPSLSIEAINRVLGREKVQIKDRLG